MINIFLSNKNSSLPPTYQLDKSLQEQDVAEEEIPLIFRSEIAFLGNRMPNDTRDKFLSVLIEQQISLSIWGDNWHKSAFWKMLKPFQKGGALMGRSYINAIQGAKICLNLPLTTKEGQYITGVIDIPYFGGLLCTERNARDVRMYQPWKEAVFWANPYECARFCNMLLRNDVVRNGIRLAGTKRIKGLLAENGGIYRYGLI